MRKGLPLLVCCAAVALLPCNARAQMLTGFPDTAEQQTGAPTQPLEEPSLTGPALASPASAMETTVLAPMPLAPTIEQPSFAQAKAIRAKEIKSLAQPDAQAGAKAGTEVSVPGKKQKQKATSGNGDTSAPVDLAADNLIHDETGQIITASGHVELRQSGRILKSDRMVYDLNTDTVTATGHVMFMDTNGDIHFSSKMVMTNQMKDGFVQGLESYLAQGGKFTAKEGTRKDGTVTIMKNVTYTTCDCGDDEKGNPPWLLRAHQAKYDQTAHRVSYKDATMDLYGEPVLWTPYFAHSDGQIKQQSGFLTPEFGFQSTLGANVTNRYYWGIAPDQDATLGVMTMTNKNPLLLGQYRQRFDNGQLNVNGTTTYSAPTKTVAGVTVDENEQMRGDLFADGLWDINNEWRSGLKLQMASDDTYLQKYDLSGSDILQNEIYAERFSGRDYAVIRGMAFQDLRQPVTSLTAADILANTPTKSDQPDVLPEISANFEGEPNAALGGRWDANVSALGLTRLGDGQDVYRLSATGGWQRRLMTGLGDVTTVDASVREDAYQIDDRAMTGPGSAPDSNNSFASRLFPEMHATTSYPLVKQLNNAQLMIGPEVSLTLAPNMNDNNDGIPNEDSQDVQLDADNIFDANRFPGYDLIEDGSHMAYGVRTGVYDDQSHGEVFLGQSYRFHQADNPFPDGSGLSSQASDIVGQINADYENRYGLNYSFDLASDSLASEQHEFYGYANWDKLQLNARYLFTKALEGTVIDESREQLQTMATYKVAEDWKVRAGALYDLGQDQGLRRAILGLDFTGCCILFSLTAVHSVTTVASGSNGTDVTFRIGFKGLGEFSSAKK